MPKLFSRDLDKRLVLVIHDRKHIQSFQSILQFLQKSLVFLISALLLQLKVSQLLEDLGNLRKDVVDIQIFQSI
jgi:hypothetical protein